MPRKNRTERGRQIGRAEEDLADFVRFANRDLAKPADRRAAREDLRALLGISTRRRRRTDPFVPVKAMGELDSCPDGELKPVWNAITVLLRNFASRRETGHPVARLSSIRMEAFNGWREQEEHFVVAVDGALIDVVCLKLFMVAATTVRRLKLCPLPECGRMFWRSRRQEYCSTKHQMRAHMRLVRARDPSRGRR